DYWLASAPRGPVSLSITDANGGLVREFRSDDPPESLKTDVYFQKVWLQPQRTLPGGQGMHRFVWDLRYPRPAARAFRNCTSAAMGGGTRAQPFGPFVLPGRYTVTLRADGTAKSRRLDVRLDPRVDTGHDALVAQLRLSQAIDSSLVHAWTTYD